MTSELFRINGVSTLVNSNLAAKGRGVKIVKLRKNSRVSRIKTSTRVCYICEINKNLKKVYKRLLRHTMPTKTKWGNILIK